MRKTNRITDIASCGQNVFCIRQQLRASGQVKKAACLVTHPGESLHGVLVYFLYLFSPGHDVFFWGMFFFISDALRPVLNPTRRFKKICSRTACVQKMSPQLCFLHVNHQLHKTQCSATTSGRYRSACVDKQLFRVERGWREKLTIKDVSHTGFSI